MRPLADARRTVLDGVPRLPAARRAVGDALHGVTAEPAVAHGPVPPFDNSAMDGFAVRSEDVARCPVRLKVIEDVPAGSAPKMFVGPGMATRIMTGAPMPGGADAVVMVERTSMVDAETVQIEESVEVGTAVRVAGGDVAPGQLLVDEGVRLDGRHLAVLAAAGVSPVVSDLPVVAIMSTGDEVHQPAVVDLPPGGIRDTNRVMLTSALAELGVGVWDLGIIGDDVSALEDAYRRAAADADLIISTGGVSMGDYDFVKQVLGDLGSVEFWKVAMQPAKPFAFGRVSGVPLFGLPGNPVSSFVAFEQFVRPAILHMMGARRLLRPRIVGTMGEDVDTSDEKEVFLRVLLADDGGRFVAVRSGGQGSNIISGLAAADAFAVVPVGTGSVSAGDPVALEMFRWPESRGIDG